MTDQNISKYFLLGLSTVAIIFFAFEINEFLNPLILFGLLIFTLYPLKENLFAKRLLWITFIFFVIWFVNMLTGLLAPFIFAFGLAYLFDPLINWLCEKRVPRWLASLVITAIGMIGLILTVLLIIPEVSRQISALLILSKQLPDKIIEWIRAISDIELIDKLNIDLLVIENEFKELIKNKVGDVGQMTANFATKIAQSIPKLISLIFNIILIPILSFYFLNDFEHIKDTFYKTVPKVYMSSLHKYLELAGSIFRQYLRGYLIIMSIEIILYISIFSLIGLKYPLVLGIVAGAMLFVPYIGIFISITLTMTVILIGSQSYGEPILFSAITYTVMQSLENFFFIPKIVGERVNLNPILIFLSIILFSYFIGFMGILIAIPVSAFLVAIYKHEMFSEPLALPKKTD